MKYKQLWDLIFPVNCLGCFAPGAYLCPNCWPKKVRRPLRRTKVFLKPNFLDQIVAATDYQQMLVRRVILAWKYQFVRELSAPLAVLVEPKHLRPFVGYELMPIPLHRRRRRWREFNQAVDLAQILAARFSFKLLLNVLERSAYRTPQRELARKERLKNAQGIFQVIDRRQVRGKKILLVDDVLTTGATLNEAARVLKAAGALKVSALVLAAQTREIKKTSKKKF